MQPSNQQYLCVCDKKFNNNNRAIYNFNVTDFKNVSLQVWYGHVKFKHNKKSNI